jgi:adhesin transport system membrane fusion protein
VTLENDALLKRESPSREPRSRRRLSKDDIRFMNSLNAAVLAENPLRPQLLLIVITMTVLSLILWASFAEIDERTKGIGRIIPSQQVQVVQNLEGGIIKKILVSEGELVKQGQILVMIDDTGPGSTFAESMTVMNELVARSRRLRAEAGIKPFSIDEDTSDKMHALLEKEERLYNTNMRRKKSELAVLEQRLTQRRIELSEARQNLRSLQKSIGMIAREIELTEPLFKKRLVSELEFLQLQQRSLEKQNELDSAQKMVKTLTSRIAEAQNQIDELQDKHRGEAQEEFNKVMAEIERMAMAQVAIEDRVERTNVRSPVDGTVKQLLVNTVGGVVQPGMDIVQIVPNEKGLLVEARIKPSDIAFLAPGLKAIVKLTAYDYAIYGGLEGKVRHISADTITSEDRREEYYLVRVETEKDYLGSEKGKKKTMVGMTAEVDIITGKKTILQYLMKPILRAKHNALRER